MKAIRLLFCLTLGVGGGLLSSLSAHAHGDEDHGAPASTSAASPAAPRAPRIEAVSEQFEWVGTLQGDKLVMTLDRFATNEPVTGAKIDIEDGASKASATERDGVYTVAARWLSTPGTHALVVTVQAGSVADLLAGDLIVASPAAPPSAGGWMNLRLAAAAATVFAAVLIVITMAQITRITRRRRAALAEAAR